MKLSVNWVKQYLDFELPTTDVLVDKIGAQLGAVEAVIDVGAKYHGVVVVKVVDCTKLEGSDHLSVCRIDDGGITPDVKRDEQGYVQVVCGAPNVTAGVTVAWLPPGSTVPSSVGKDPFVLEARELRGTMSNGMLASAKELAIGESHEGLLLIDKPAKPGDSFAAVYDLNDTVIDIENKMFTHRPDCFGTLGLAREVAGILGHAFHSPADYTTSPADDSWDNGLQLSVRNELPELVPRLITQVFSTIKIGPSPIELQVKLSLLGIRPINNIVDITNYVMLLTGQPLHAYDYDKVKALDGGETASLIVRNPRDNERLTLLNGKTIDPRQQAIIIASATKPIGLGGVMGGAETEVTDQTTSIILECGSFDMYSIRRTSMAHGIFSEAVTRLNKGQSPLQNDRVIAMARELLAKYAGATPGQLNDQNSLSADTQSRQSLHRAISVSSDFINARLGVELTAEAMATLLTNVEFAVTIDGNNLTVSAPFWRTDIELREDIVEEIGRLNGFDALPLVLPTRSISPTAIDALLATKAKVRQTLSHSGAQELLTYSFVPGSLLTNVGQDAQQAFQISNALSPDLQYYRLSLTPSLLDKVHPNIKAGYEQFTIFEIGKTHQLPTAEHNDVPYEFERVAAVFAADAKVAKRYSGAAYYQARAYLESLLAAFGLGERVRFVALNPEQYDQATTQAISYYQPGRAATVILDDKVLGEIGEYKRSVRKNLKLPEYCAGFEVDLSLLKAAGTNATSYEPLSRFPKVEQDICLRVPSSVSYAELLSLVNSALDAVIGEQQVRRSVKPVDIYERPDNPDHAQTTFRVSVSHFERTLTDQEVNGWLDAVAHTASEKLKAERV